MSGLPTLPERPTAEQVRNALQGAGERLHGLQTTDPEKRGDSFRDDVKATAEFITNYDAVLTAIERGASSPHPDLAATEPLANPGRQSLGQLVVNDESLQSLASRSGSANATHIEVNVRGSYASHNHQYRTLVDSGDNLTGGAGGLLPQGDPIAPRPRQQRLFIRDVLNVVETGLSSVPYVREYTPVVTELGASSVSEAAAKPEVEMLWESDDAPVRKIAGWVPVTTEIIEDAPTLAGYIDGRLAYMLAVREEEQVLAGSGVSPQLKGILNFAGVQAQAFSTDIATTLGLAIGKVEAVDGDVDGIVMHPTDYWVMVTTRSASQFDAGFGTGAPAGSPFGTAWGIPVIRSRARAAGSAIVGNWGLGATLFDRMETTIRVGNQHSDFFTTNKVAVLAEERIALAVHRPDFFVNAALA